MNFDRRLLEHAGIEHPIICGAMYPCSNPELVAAVSAAGGLGVVQPISLTYVYKQDLREGLRLMGRLAGGKPYGFNALIEASSKVYLDRMRRWVDVALEEGCRFFVTSLGDPAWVVKAVHAAGGRVYHDVTERKWALKALEGGVDGLIAVNSQAGGHAGKLSPQELYRDLEGLGVPVVCAGGIGDEETFKEALRLGYAGVQMGTRFIATRESAAHDDYKQAILKARAEDIVLTERLSGVPVSVIRTPHIEKIGTKAGPLARWLLRHPRFKHWMRLYYGVNSIRELKQAALKGEAYRDFWQAGKSVEGIERIETSAEIVERFARAITD